MRDHVARLHGVRELARAVSAVSSVTELVERCADAAVSALDATSASVSRFEPADGRARVLHTAGPLGEVPSEWAPGQTYSLALYPRSRILTGRGESWLGSVDDAGTYESDADLLRRFGSVHGAAFGLQVDERMWGELYATRSAARFGPDDVVIGRTLAELMSVGLRRLQLTDDLARFAYTDPLTGVANRRAADEWLEQRLAVVQPFPPVSIVLCDINGLKQINDAFGHTAGDALIRLVAEHLSSAADGLPDALVARIGGDEFVLLSDGAPKEQVEAAVARLGTIRLPHGGGIAVGAATAVSRPVGADSSTTAIRALMRLADAALYQHKQSRRLSARSLESTASTVGVLYPLRAHGLADRVLDDLSRSPDRSVEWRLQLVGDAMAEAFTVASWWVSRCDGDALVDVLGRIVRDDSRGELAQTDYWVSGTEFSTADFPATARALDGGSYFASLTEGDERERDFVARMGAVSALAAGERDAAGTQWLLELFADPQTSAGLAIARPLLRTLVHVAVSGADVG